MSHAPPAGYRSVSAYLVVPEPEAVADFAAAVFGATQVEPALRDAGGRIRHVALAIGDSVVMAGRAADGHPVQTAMLHVYVADADATYAAALAAGAAEVMALADQDYGDRSGGVRDGQGVTWWIATRKAATR
jgi:uncharacterized glyoxalase superfamily protein PhnB